MSNAMIGHAMDWIATSPEHTVTIRTLDGQAVTRVRFTVNEDYLAAWNPSSPDVVRLVPFGVINQIVLTPPPDGTL